MVVAATGGSGLVVTGQIFSFALKSGATCAVINGVTYRVVKGGSFKDFKREVCSGFAFGYEAGAVIGTVKFIKASSTVKKSGSSFKGQLYNGKRNPHVDFVNGKGKSTLNKHASKHGYTSPKEYIKDARNFLDKKPTSTIQSFVSNEGTYFRYDTATNEFGIINEYGGISTYFKPENGMAYWLEQIEKYAPK